MTSFPMYINLLLKRHLGMDYGLALFVLKSVDE